MSDRRDRLVALRTKLLMGDPPYTIDPVLGNKTRERGGKPGLDELNGIGDYSPGAASARLALEIQLEILEDMIERTR